jgi:hypothetical protein
MNIPIPPGLQSALGRMNDTELAGFLHGFSLGICTEMLVGAMSDRERQAFFQAMKTHYPEDFRYVSKLDQKWK